MICDDVVEEMKIATVKMLCSLVNHRLGGCSGNFMLHSHLKRQSYKLGLGWTFYFEWVISDDWNELLSYEALLFKNNIPLTATTSVYESLKANNLTDTWNEWYYISTILTLSYPFLTPPLLPAPPFLWWWYRRMWRAAGGGALQSFREEKCVCVFVCHIPFSGSQWVCVLVPVYVLAFIYYPCMGVTTEPEE